MTTSLKSWELSLSSTSISISCVSLFCSSIWDVWEAAIDWLLITGIEVFESSDLSLKLLSLTDSVVECWEFVDSFLAEFSIAWGLLVLESSESFLGSGFTKTRDSTNACSFATSFFLTMSDRMSFHLWDFLNLFALNPILLRSDVRKKWELKKISIK